MSNTVQALPSGIYVVDARFLETEEKEVVVRFRGVDYAATVGVNAFGLFDQMAQAADTTPSQPFCGRTFDSPVAIVPAGVHECPRKREYLPIKLAQGITILGEQMGLSPNAPEDLTLPNPTRSGEESVLLGSLYWGTLALVDGAPGKLTLDGLTLDNYRVSDRRTQGADLGIEVRNCIITGAHHANCVDSSPLSDSESTRTVTVCDCRCDGFDSMDGRGRFINTCATQLTIERLYYANTKEFFGLTDYGREFVNTIPHTPSSITLRGCSFSNYVGPRGVNVLLPEDAKDVSICVEDCSFRDFGDKNTPALFVNLPNNTCSLTVRNTVFSSTQNAEVAVLADAEESAPIRLENVSLDGTQTLLTYKPPRRTYAPAQIGEVVWSEDRLEDPHPLCTDETATEEALRQLNAMYSGRQALHGDMHAHSNSGGTSDGKTPLAEFIKQLKTFGLDFAAIVDHHQIRHCLLPEWDDMLICGTEPSNALNDPNRPMRARKMDYCMLFQHPSDYFRVMEAFPEFKFTGGPDGHNGYPSHTPERMAELSRFIYSLGGLMVHAHPKQLMASDDPLDYYFGDYMPLETIVGHANSFDTVQNRNLWESLLKLGKRVHTHGMSDTHVEAKNCALTTVYAREKKGAAVLREVREGDCAAGSIGVKMAINGARMGSSLPYREGLTLAVKLDDYYKPTMLDDTVYCLKVYTDQGLAYASEFDGKQPQQLVIPVQNRKYYRVEVTNESDGHFVSISNPIWLD